MLQVLTAELIARERELAIQRRLREGAIRRDAAEATRAPAAVPAAQHDPAVHGAGRRCGACAPSAVGAC